MVTKSELLGAASAIKFRDELLEKGWPDNHRVAGLAGKASGPEATTYAIRAQASDDLLGVWSAPRHCFLYPDFQFDRSGAIRRDVAGLLAVMPREDDRGGWRRTFWLYSPHALLDDRTPAEIFIDDPTRVIAVAREEFLGDREATWRTVDRSPPPRGAGRTSISRVLGTLRTGFVARRGADEPHTGRWPVHWPHLFPGANHDRATHPEWPGVSRSTTVAPRSGWTPPSARRAGADQLLALMSGVERYEVQNVLDLPAGGRRTIVATHGWSAEAFGSHRFLQPAWERRWLRFALGLHAPLT